MENKEYQKRELAEFMGKKLGYFDTVADFADSLEEMDIGEQIEWIENGSYGAGACLALQRAFNGLNNRVNKTARIGLVVLRAFYGAEFTKYNKFPKKVRVKLDRAVNKWITAKKHDFAMKLEV